MTCETCVTVKDRPNTYTRCKKCEGWREMSEAEKITSAKPYRFDGNGVASRSY